MQRVSVQPGSASLTVGEQAGLAATAVDRGGGVIFGVSVTWSSSNASVARVDSTGNITAVAPGEAVITARAGSQSGAARVRVSAPQTANRIVNPPPPGNGNRQTKTQQTQQDVTPPVTGGPGTVKLGTRSDNPAVLFINGQPQGAISSLQEWPAPSGIVRLSIRVSDACKWDSTVVVAPGRLTSIGYRTPECN